jgi:hypothetical protein
VKLFGKGQTGTFCENRVGNEQRGVGRETLSEARSSIGEDEVIKGGAKWVHSIPCIWNIREKQMNGLEIWIRVKGRRSDTYPQMIRPSLKPRTIPNVGIGQNQMIL